MSVDFASCFLVSCLLSFTFSMCCPLSVFHFCFCELKTYWKCNYFATCRRNETSSAERRRREHTCSNQLSGQLLGLLVVELTSLTPINYIVLWLSGKITNCQSFIVPLVCLIFVNSESILQHHTRFNHLEMVFRMERAEGALQSHTPGQPAGWLNSCPRQTLPCRNYGNIHMRTKKMERGTKIRLARDKREKTQ